eukprot:4018324-Prymnesium_polylepis.1
MACAGLAAAGGGGPSGSISERWINPPPSGLIQGGTFRDGVSYPRFSGSPRGCALWDHAPRAGLTSYRSLNPSEVQISDTRRSGNQLRYTGKANCAQCSMAQDKRCAGHARVDEEGRLSQLDAAAATNVEVGAVERRARAQHLLQLRRQLLAAVDITVAHDLERRAHLTRVATRRHAHGTCAKSHPQAHAAGARSAFEYRCAARAHQLDVRDALLEHA